MKTVKELQLLPAEAYLSPDNFNTHFDIDGSPEYAKKQYQTGLTHGNEYDEIHISYQGTWSGSSKGFRSFTTYECIGYHASTCEILRGILDSTAQVIVYRECPKTGKIIKHVIKESSK